MNGGPFRVAQTVRLASGGTIAVTNDDVMPHHLIKVSGPAVRMHNGDSMPMHMGYRADDGPGHMDHTGAMTTVTFTKSGTYTFKNNRRRGLHVRHPDGRLRQPTPSDSRRQVSDPFV